MDQDNESKIRIPGPPPGSIAAGKMGCCCPVIDNRLKIDGNYVLNDDCKIHYTPAVKAEVEAAMKERVDACKAAQEQEKQQQQPDILVDILSELRFISRIIAGSDLSKEAMTHPRSYDKEINDGDKKTQ